MSTISDTSDRPHIPRYWWLKRIFATSLGALLILGLVRLAWGLDTNRRVEAMFADIRSRGEAVDPLELIPSPISDEQNFVYHMKQAIAAVSGAVESQSPSQSDLDFPNHPPYPPEWHTMAKAAIEASPNAFKLAREARRYPQVGWTIDRSKPLMDAVLDESYSGARNLANVLGDASLYQHLQGNDREATELVRDILAMADAIDHGPALISHLVAGGLEGLAIDRAMIIGAAIRIDSEANPSHSSASREQVQALITRLLDDRHDRRLERILQFERLLTLDVVQRYSQHNTLLRPMFTRETEILLGKWGTAIDAVRRDQLSYAKAISPKGSGVTLHIPGLTRAPDSDIRLVPRELSSLFSTSPERLLETSMRLRAERQMTAVSLAMALYLLDNADRIPSSLEQLVPRYLPAIPDDPFSEPRQSLQYVIRSDGKRPIVYSLGPNGIDDTAAGTPIPLQPQFGMFRSPDLWRDLIFSPPPTSQSQ